MEWNPLPNEAESILGWQQPGLLLHLLASAITRAYSYSQHIRLAPPNPHIPSAYETLQGPCCNKYFHCRRMLKMLTMMMMKMLSMMMMMLMMMMMQSWHVQTRAYLLEQPNLMCHFTSVLAAQHRHKSQIINNIKSKKYEIFTLIKGTQSTGKTIFFFA